MEQLFNMIVEDFMEANKKAAEERIMKEEDETIIFSKDTLKLHSKSNCLCQ